MVKRSRSCGLGGYFRASRQGDPSARTIATSLIAGARGERSEGGGGPAWRARPGDR